MKSIVMLRNFIAKKGVTLWYRNLKWMKWLQRPITDFTYLTFLPLFCCDLIENR